MVHIAKVSPKVIEGVRNALTHHERQVQHESQVEEAFHQEMIAYYRLLLECWEESSK
jgi:hypothetical protein